MVKITPVDPASIPTGRDSRRGRVSYPLIKMFLEANVKVAKLEDLPTDKSSQYLRSVLHSYIINHKLPIKVFSASGDLHLMRLDMDNDGNVDPNWEWEDPATEGAGGTLRDLPPTPITADEVAKRSKTEKRNITK